MTEAGTESESDLERLHAAARSTGVDSERLFELASALRKSDRPDEADRVYRQLLAQNPRHVAAHLARGWLARERDDEPGAVGHFSAALEQLNAANGGDPAGPAQRSQLATVLRELGRFDEAAEIYRRLLADDPQHAAAHEGLAWIARKRQDFATALGHFRTVAELRPEDGVAQINLARLLAEMNRVTEAKSVYNELCARTPDAAAPMRAALGRLARSWSDWDGASRHFESASRSDPNNLSWRLERACALRELGRLDEAWAVYSGVLAASPDDVEAMIGLAETAVARGDPDAALAWYEKAARSSPLDYRPKRAIRFLSVARGSYDWKQEIADAMAVARAADAPLNVQLEAAKALVQYGLTQQAAPLLERLGPHSAAARQLLLALRQVERLGLSQNATARIDGPEPADADLESLCGVIEKPVPGSDTLLVVFAGTNHRMWLTFSLLHGILKKSGVSIVYARDLRQDWYARGVVGLGEDFAAGVDGLRALARRFGARRTLMLGNCVGCLAALRFGLALEADGVLALGPRMRPGDVRGSEHRMSLSSFRHGIGLGVKKMRDRYLAANRRPRVTLIYGEHCPGDAEDARTMSAVPGVVLQAIPGSSEPDSLRDLLVLGLLDEVLLDFVAGGTVAPEILARITAVPLT